MPIPDFQSLMRPLLVRIQDAQPHKFGDLVPLVAHDLHLTGDELELLLPSGRQGMFRNRLHWASFYMLRAGLLERPKKGWLRITPRGAEALQSAETINSKYLQRFEEFREFQKGAGGGEGGGGVTPPPEPRTPEELLEQGYASIATPSLQSFSPRSRAALQHFSSSSSSTFL
ncbi:MAG: winged helix-turn-helix domain-containing protein [Vicinamibacterales bacterium]